MVIVMVVLVMVMLRHHGCVKIVTVTRGSHHVVDSLHREQLVQQGFCLVKVLWPRQL